MFAESDVRGCAQAVEDYHAQIASVASTILDEFRWELQQCNTLRYISQSDRLKGS